MFAAASLACALATGDGFLIAARAVQGIGAAVMVPAALSIVMNMFEEGAERNKALGIWGAVAASGATVGLVAGGLMTRTPAGSTSSTSTSRSPSPHWCWRCGPSPRAGSPPTRPRFDVLGAVVGTGGIVALVYAISQAPQYGWAAARTVAVLAAAAALLVAFLVIESRTKDPILPLSIFRLRSLAGANVAGLLLGGGFFAFFFVGTLYMQQVLRYSALQSGVAWLATSITSVALAALSQYLVTRLGPKVVMAIGMTLIGAGVLWATQVPVHGRYLGNLFGPLLVAGAGTAFAFIPISIAGLAGVEENRAGLASGLLNTSQQVGGAIGIAIASSIAASHTKALLHAGHTMPSALTGGYEHAFWALGAIALSSLPAIVALVRRNEVPDALARTMVREPQSALAAPN